MKELTIEEKYELALKKAMKLYERGTITESLSYIFPELKESEDEKIRKKLISFVENWNKGGIFSKYTSNANDIKRILAWLEKQGEQKSAWSEEDALRLEEVICMIEANGRWVRSDDAVKSVLDWLKSLQQRIGE